MSECRNFFGYGSLQELFEEILKYDEDIEFYYEDKKYMISSELIGSRRHKEFKRCFSYQSGSHEDYLSTLQAYDTWDELFEKAHFLDGALLIDEMKK